MSSGRACLTLRIRSVHTCEIDDEMGQILGVHAEPNHPAMDWEPHAHFQLNLMLNIMSMKIVAATIFNYQCRKKHSTGTPYYAEIKYTTIKC